MAFFDQSEWADSYYSAGWQKGENSSPVLSPATREQIGSVAAATAAEIDRAVEAGVEAQIEWAARPAADRAEVMRRASIALAEHADILQGWLMDEGGAAEGKAAFEASLVAGEFDLAAATAMMPYGKLLQTGKPRLSIARHKPVGVVGVISPFNFPAILAMRSVAPALALGNAVVLKPDPRTAVCGGLFFAAIFEEAGLPAGLFAVLPGGAEPGSALIEHPKVPVISFTGSTPAGRAIGERAGALLKRTHLELGGNNALVVLEDADVEAAASSGAWGAFLHQGQVCMTAGRHLVHESLYERYVELLAEKARNLPAAEPRSGAPLGPIIDEKQRDRIHSLVTQTVDAGGELLAGGRYDGLHYQATVLGNMKLTYPAFAEEIFGPVAPVMPFSTIDELVGIVNASEYGLSLSVLTSDPLRALALADRMPSGILHINDQTVDDEPQAPFGGVGASGTGARFGGHEANIEAFTDTQWVTMQSDIERYPF